MDDSIQIGDLHGALLTVNDDEGREVLTGFTCEDYPDCDTCGHIDEEHADTDESVEDTDSLGFDREDVPWSDVGV